MEYSRRHMDKNYFAYITLLLIILISCKKYETAKDGTGDLFDRPYCNNPEAVNYNDGFPGTADSTVCFFPKDVFVGTYLWKDTIFNAEFELDTVMEYTISVYANNNTELRLLGFCPSGDSLHFVADRFYKAQADSLILPDSTQLPGILSCGTKDTLTGTIINTREDTVKLKFNWTISSDTGINYHIGTAVKQ